MRSLVTAIWLGYAASATTLLPAAVSAQAPRPDTTRYVEVDGACLLVRTAGRGTPVVILHGGPGLSHDYLAPQLIAQLAADHQLIF